MGGYDQPLVLAPSPDDKTAAVGRGGGLIPPVLASKQAGRATSGVDSRLLKALLNCQVHLFYKCVSRANHALFQPGIV